MNRTRHDIFAQATEGEGPAGPLRGNQDESIGATDTPQHAQDRPTWREEIADSQNIRAPEDDGDSAEDLAPA